VNDEHDRYRKNCSCNPCKFSSNHKSKDSNKWRQSNAFFHDKRHNKSVFRLMNDNKKNNSVGADQTNHVKFRRSELLDEDIQEIRKESPVMVKVMVDGPIVIKGSFILDHSGNKKEIKESLVSICRCGASDHMPFCDGQHRKIGFTG